MPVRLDLPSPLYVGCGKLKHNGSPEVLLSAPRNGFRAGVAATLSGALWFAASPAGAADPALDARQPIRIAQAATQAAPGANPTAQDAAIRAAVSAWAKAWAAKDVERYLASYAPAFKPPDGRSRKAWEQLRRSRIAGPRSIEVSLGPVEVRRHDDARAAATFQQDYRSDSYRDSIRKTLELVRDGERWLIVEERVGSTVAETRAAPAPKPTDAAAPAVTPASAISAGLGEIHVLSRLGQPLRAEIDLVSLRSGEQDSVNVRLASVEAFSRAGMDFHPALSRARLTIESRDGKPVVVVTTRESVNEPILDLLVELEWGAGRLTREYAILLDPPTYIPPPPAHAVMGPTPPAAQAAAPAAAAPSPPPPPAKPDSEYRVKPGDTLAKIAAAHQPAGVTLDQMLIALYRANIGAFVDDDINLLRAGHVLRIPDRDAVAAIDPDDAKQALGAQMARSAEGRRAIAAAAPAAPRTEAPRAIPQPAPSPDQVKLARAREAEAAAAATAAREDDRVAHERALAETKSRIAELETIVADLRKLLEIRNQRLAELEKQAAETAAATASAPTAAKPAVEAPKPVVEAPKPAPAAEAPKPAPAAEAPKPAAETPKPAPAAEAPKPAAETPKPAPTAEAPKPAPAATKPAAAPKPAATPRPAPPPAPEPSLVERYVGDLGDPVMLGGLGVVTLLLIAYGAYAWRRKKRAARSQLSESLLSATAGGAAAMGAAAAPVAAAPPSDEADPLEEADVYLAYGRDAQAEELLREAVDKGEKRPVAYSKLLQIYAKQHDTSKFEATALKLKGLVNGEGPEWEKAMALGRSVDPGNGLYGQGEAAEVAANTEMNEEPEVDFDLDAASAAGEPTTPKTVDFAIDTTTGIDRSAQGNAALDFDLGSSTSEEPAAAQAAAPAAAPEPGGIDFDLGGTTSERPATPSTEEAPEHIALEFDLGDTPEAPAAGGGIDAGLSFDLDGAEQTPAEKSAAPAAAEKHLDTISFDLGGTESAAPSTGGGDAKWQEVTTKLQLAKSFEEIGDAEGARELLKEVVAEGDAAQRAHAEQMLASLK
jgi:pilus assembly protein FimV